MGKREKSSPAERRYPRFWERAVPIILGVVALLIVILLVVAVAVVLGVLPGLRASNAVTDTAALVSCPFLYQGG